MIIVSWNVNGIRSVQNKGLLVPFIKKYSPDILCLQETKANKDQVKLDLKEYIEYWNSAEKKGYSGTAIFTKLRPINVINNFPPEIVDKFGPFNDEYGDTNSEGRLITAEYKDFFVVTVYTPNAKDELSRILFAFKEGLWNRRKLDHKPLPSDF
jgi:exodeoxyribonuclease-3